MAASINRYNRYNVDSHWQTSVFTLQHMFASSAMKYTLKYENVIECTRMGITVLKSVISEVNRWFMIANCFANCCRVAVKQNLWP